MSDETREGSGLRLAWSTEGPSRYGMHDGVIEASVYELPDGAWVGDPDLPARADAIQAAREAEAAALVGALARLSTARDLVLVLEGSL